MTSENGTTSDDERSASSASTEGAIATPNRNITRKVKKQSSIDSPDNYDQNNTTSCSVSVSTAGFSTIEQKRLRKRMTMMELERNRSFNTSHLFQSSYSMTRSFDQVEEEKATIQAAKQAVAAKAQDTSTMSGLGTTNSFIYDVDEENEQEKDGSSAVMTDRVAELRRRRIFEMHHNRPYPNTKPKKKFKFWEQQDSRQQTPNILLSKSFSVQRTVSASLPKGHQKQQRQQQPQQDVYHLSRIIKR